MRLDDGRNIATRLGRPRPLRQMAIGASAALVIAAIALNCGRPSGLRAALLSPIRDDARAWQSLDGSCDSLRAFLRDHPNGYHAAEARARLDGKKPTTLRTSVTINRQIPIYVGSDRAPVASSQSAALTATRTKASELGRMLCESIALSDDARLNRVLLLPGSMNCAPGKGGIQCTLDASVNCEINQPHAFTQELCLKKQAD